MKAPAFQRGVGMRGTYSKAVIGVGLAAANRRTRLALRSAPGVGLRGGDLDAGRQVAALSERAGVVLRSRKRDERGEED
jgi:hypothetical protein